MLTADKLKEFAKSTLKSETATDEQKALAKKTIKRLAARKESAAELESFKKPIRKNYATDQDYRAALNVHWDVLDRRATRMQAETVLNDKTSTPLVRHNARARLDALDGPLPEPEDEPDEKKAKSNFPTRNDFGFESGEAWAEFVASGKEAEFQAALAKWSETAPPPSDPIVAAFLKGLNEESVKVTRPAPQPITPKPPIALPPPDPTLYCEHCRVPFKVCGCDRVICNLCLHPQANCYSPCPNSRRRS